MLEGEIMDALLYKNPIFEYMIVKSGNQDYGLIPKLADWSPSLREVAVRGGEIEFLRMDSKDQEVFAPLILALLSPLYGTNIPLGSRVGEGTILKFAPQAPKRGNLVILESIGDEGAKHYSLKKEVSQPQNLSDSRIVGEWAQHLIEFSIVKNGREFHKNTLEAYEVHYKSKR